MNYDNVTQAFLSKNRTDIEIKRSLVTGEINFWDFEESFVEDFSLNAKNSTSFTRDPSKFSNFVRGASSNYPFAPGNIAS